MWIGRDTWFQSLSQRFATDHIENYKEKQRYYDSFLEAICVERLIKRCRLEKAKMQEEKFQQMTEAHVVVPIMENVKDDVEEQKQETNDFPTNSNEVIDKIPPPEPTLGTHWKTNKLILFLLTMMISKCKHWRKKKQTLKNWM